LSLAAAPAFASTGTINFAGDITATTCPIEIVNPESGAVGNLISMGTVTASQFTAAGTERNQRFFSMRINPTGPGCALDADVTDANVTFQPVHGAAGAGNVYYGLKPVTGSATGVALVVKDRAGTRIVPGAASIDYPISATETRDLLFSASLIRVGDPAVTAGPAQADVNFSVAYK
jgi:major type 1 subunit fimbrin (pilin)